MVKFYAFMGGTMQKLLTFLIVNLATFSGVKAAEIVESVKTVQIPTTQYVRDYLSTAGKLPDLKLENVSSFQIPTEKYIFSAIDHVNAENGTETHYADNASTGIPMDLSYFLEQTEQKLETCPVPWDDNVAPATMSHLSLSVKRAEAGPSYYTWFPYNTKYNTLVRTEYLRDIGVYGNAMYSTDEGATWNQSIGLPSDASIYYEMTNDNSGIMIAAANKNNTVLTTPYYSDDGGKSWNVATGFASASFIDIFGCDDVTGMWCVGLGTNYVYPQTYMMYNSYDGGKTWQQNNNWPIDEELRGVNIVNDMAIGVGGPYENIMYSDDRGQTWHQPTAWPTEMRAQGNPIYKDGLFIEMASEKSNEYVIAYSHNGKDWNFTDVLPTWVSCHLYTYADGNFIAFGGNDNYPSNVAMYSEDGKTWQEATLPVKDWWIDTAFYPGILFAFGALQSVGVYSVDGGKTWEKIDINEPVYGVIYKDGLFLLLAENVFYSFDGVKWFLNKEVENAQIAVGGDFMYINGGAKISLNNTNPWAVGENCDIDATTVDTMCSPTLVAGDAICENKQCYCKRTHLRDGDTLMPNANKSPILVPGRVFENDNVCNIHCADVCADNTVNNTDGVQKEILCGQ